MSASMDNIKAKYKAVADEWRLVDCAIKNILKSGVTTASITSGGGSKSYSNLDLPMLYARRTELGRTLAILRREYRGARGTQILHRMAVRS